MGINQRMALLMEKDEKALVGDDLEVFFDHNMLNDTNTLQEHQRRA